MRLQSTEKLFNVFSLFPFVEEEKPQSPGSKKQLVCQNEEELQVGSNVRGTGKSESENENKAEAIERATTENKVGRNMDNGEDSKENGVEMEDKISEGADREVEGIECEIVELVESSQNEDGNLRDETEQTDKDEVDSDDEVMSPDVIPSSQTPSFESPFQSLRQITIPPDSILPGLIQTRASIQRNSKREQNNLGNSDGKNVDTALETQLESDVLKEDKFFDSDSPMKVEEQPITKTKVSPVAGRTRRKLQQKIEMTPTLEKPQEEPTEQEISRIMLSGQQLAETEKLGDETPMEKPAEPFVAGVTRDETSSPVLNAKSKFLRPFAAGGSPCRLNLRGRNSPGVSPTTGILKRYHAIKQGVDSPSPPGKVVIINVVIYLIAHLVFSGVVNW